ncbi:hypothetical protein JCM10207_004260 [Rhodosporidiobolus poonsookiae]
MASFFTSLVASQLHAVVNSLTSPLLSNWAEYDQVLAAPSLPAPCLEPATSKISTFSSRAATPSAACKPAARAYNRLLERLEREDRRFRREGEYASPDGFGALLLEEALQSTVFSDRVDECDFALDTDPFEDDEASLFSPSESASSAVDSDAETATIASTAATSLRSLAKRA